MKQPGSPLSRLVRNARRDMAVVAVLSAVISHPISALADATPPALLDPNLQVTVELAANAGISQPIGIVFLGLNDYLVLEKASGQIKRVINRVIQPNPVLDLAVNSNSERGLLSMVLHPNFPDVPFAFVRWTESSTGADSTVVSEVPLTGNRVDR
jgi:glucose/arabinose dehydrogenase